ncbi:hypothetical protein [Sutcliffiella cohnii]|uniref:hypothetical protein n=1 Tax=Sutcliffiella cohnii TaxID=33932 RepID=UPI002E2082FA|nr:hypothetical protein [Sutcliffiella cohnii]
MNFTHCLDLSNRYVGTAKGEVRNKENKQNFNRVVMYFLDQADSVAWKYWPGDLQVAEESNVSTKGYNLLLPNRIKDMPIEEGMQISYFSIESTTKEVLLKNSSPDIPTDVFDFQLLNNGNVLLHSFDNGSTLLFCASTEVYHDLVKLTSPNSILPIFNKRPN